MAEVILYDVTAMSMLGIVQQLRNEGLVHNQDFEFAFHPQLRDPYEPKKAIFVFYNDQIATWFLLKYSG